MTEEQRESFKTMTSPADQMLALYDMIAFVRAKVEGMERDQIEYRHKREKREQQDAGQTEQIIKGVVDELRKFNE